jgi:hypothetical protein
MEISNDIFEVANQHGAKKKASIPEVASVRYDRRIARVVIGFALGFDISFSPKLTQGLEKASPADLMDVEITPSGLGIHFPKLDADIYIPALLEGFFGSKRWMAAENGKLGGASTSAEKAEAARQNGKLGGRPRKVKDITHQPHAV